MGDENIQMTDKNIGILRLAGLYVIKPYIVFDDDIQTHFIQFECDLTSDEEIDLSKQLSNFDFGEPIEILIYQQTNKDKQTNKDNTEHWIHDERCPKNFEQLWKNELDGTLIPQGKFRRIDK
jgi:hypothetical protein